MATYKPHNILITGAAGFIASHVTNRLVRSYPHYNIVALDKLNHHRSILKNLNSSMSSPNFKFVKGDITSADLVNYLLIAESIDTIIHFAVHKSNNMNAATRVLLEASKVSGRIKRFMIYVSNDGENDVAGNHEVSKAEMLVMEYGRSYGLPVITTRGNNFYGPHQFPEKFIPKLINLAMRGMPLHIIHGEDGFSVVRRRSYLYCDDAVEAFDVVLHKGETGNVYNITTEEERRVIDVAKDICKHFETSIEIEENRPFNDKWYSFIDNQKLKNLGWSERTSWEEGLKKTVDWYTRNPNWWGDISAVLVPHSSLLMMPCATDRIVQDTKSSRDDDLQKSSLKFLIYGRTGWIGGLLGQLCKKQGIPFEYGRGRLEDRSSLTEDIQNVKPTHVFNAAGKTGRPHVDWCETHRIETICGNVIGTLALADVCAKHGLFVMNYGSGCIFNYDDAHPEGSGASFKEEDKPNYAGSFYSKTKVTAEEFLKEYDNVCILRIRLPVSSDLNNPRNLIAKICSYNKVVNIPNSMTILDELIPISIEMAKRNLTGIWNFTNPGFVSHNEILEMYKSYIDPSFKWENFTLEEQAKVLIAPRCNNVMDASKLKKEFPDLLPIKESLIKYVFEPNKRTRARL